ncbi:hypothetical protein [Natronoflexus pectinivorans]|uniref:O-antigen ligase-like membrane protein n=1 Tax=Natronoflexus pectinivorans TaxID=682526 RepID=A0A4R2GHM2_9BACT|nr:hypothetical protein [Natronoflexus pectinivorans]TCO07876.1 hypothetical protein EV194_10616 [Natronoflexus pectinivorans]
MIINLKTLGAFFFLIFTLSSFYFYEPVFFSAELLKLVYWLLCSCVILLSVKKLLYTKEQLVFANGLRILLFSIFFSMVPAFISWGQSPLLTLRATFPFLGFISYFYLLTINPSIKFLERIIWVFSFSYIFIYFLSLSLLPEVYFGSFADRRIDDMRAVFRLFIPGRGFLFLSFFFAVGRYIYNRRIIWLYLSIFLFAVILMHVIRQYILFSFVISAIALLWNLTWWRKVLIVLSAILIGGYVIENSNVIQSLVLLTETQIGTDKPTEDIRVTAYKYFSFNFSPNAFNAFFGNGVPHEASTYGAYYTNIINADQKLYLSDVGYAQIYGLFGILGLLASLFLMIRTFFLRVDIKYLYLKLFMIYVLFANILSGYFLSYHNVVAISIVFFMLEKVHTNVGINAHTSKLDLRYKNES